MLGVTTATDAQARAPSTMPAISPVTEDELFVGPPAPAGITPAPLDDETASAGAAETLVQGEAFADAVKAVITLNKARFDQQLSHSLADDIVLGRIEEQARHADVQSVGSAESMSPSEMRELDAMAGAPRADGGGGTPGLMQFAPDASKRNQLADDDEERAPLLLQLLKGVFSTASTVLSTLLRLAWSELTLLLILVPSALAFLSHPEEPLRLEWQIWLLRPLYALVLARIADAIVFALIGNAFILSLLPTMLTLVVESFRGWPFILIAYLTTTAVFYFTEPSLIPGEAVYWEMLRQVDFLLGVNAWLASFAITRGLLEVCTQALWLNLKDGHFKERVKSALLSMRCMRLLFGTARAARARVALRIRAAPVAPPPRRGVAGAVTGAGALAVGTVGSGMRALGSSVDALGAAMRRRHRQHGVAEPPARPLPHQARTPELFIVEDALFSASNSLTALSDQVGMLVSALAKRGGFVESAHDARRRAASTFDSLLREYEFELETSRATGEPPPVDGDGPPGTIPRARLIRWCLMATRKRGARFGRKLVTKMESILPASYVSRADFTLSVDAVYREQRFINAALSSFDALNGHVHSFLVIIWAVILLLAGIFLVDWGVNLDDWVVPISSTFLSFALLLGWLPYETFAGILFVLAARPYDIGDRIVVTNPGQGDAGCEQFAVSEIGLLGTRVVSLSGQEHVLQNFITRRLGVINLHRSRAPSVAIHVQLPVRTPANKITEVMDTIEMYVATTPQDWAVVQGSSLAQPDYRLGVVKVTVFLLSVYKPFRDDLIDQARTKLYMFLHAYMLSASIEFVQPKQQVLTTFADVDGNPSKPPPNLAVPI